jgi:hypothetical protein
MLADDSKATAIQRRIFRAMTTEQRLRLALEMSGFLRNVALAGLRSRRPDLDANGLSRELARIMCGLAPQP